QESAELGEIHSVLLVVVVGRAAAPAQAAVGRNRLPHHARLRRVAWAASQRRADQPLEALLAGVGLHPLLRVEWLFHRPYQRYERWPVGPASLPPHFARNQRSAMSPDQPLPIRLVRKRPAPVLHFLRPQKPKIDQDDRDTELRQLPRP